MPHSEILGSQLVCSSPRLIAAYHVLHRLSVPRHPPCAVLCLISKLEIDFRRIPRLPRHPRNHQLSNSEPTVGDVSECGRLGHPFIHRYQAGAYSGFQKGGDPAAGSPTATLLRLRPSHRLDLRRLPPCGWPTGFGSLRLPWRDGRCVQGPGTYSPRHG